MSTEGPNPSGLCMCGCGMKTNLSTRNGHGNVRGTPMRYVIGHFNTVRARSRTIDDRFWAKVDKTGDCWVWTASLHPSGYGSISLTNGTRSYVHRVSYELLIGPIPDGLHIDHLCRNRAFTPHENWRRGFSQPRLNVYVTHCPQGHEYDEENTYVRPDRGTRECRACWPLRRAGHAA